MFRSRVASKNSLCSPEPRRADAAFRSLSLCLQGLPWPRKTPPEPLFAVSRWGISAVVPAKPICSLWVAQPTNCTVFFSFKWFSCMQHAEFVGHTTHQLHMGLQELPLKCPSVRPQPVVRQHRLYAALGCIGYFSMPLSSETQKLHDVFQFH